MKRLTILGLILLSTSALFTQNTLAQDYNRWRLPEGAIMRLGKGTVLNVAWSPDRTRLAVGDSVGIWVYDASTGEEVSLITGHSFRVNAVAFSPDGLTLASGSRDDTVRVWDVEASQEKSTLVNEKYRGLLNSPWVVSVVFSPDGRTLASANRDTTMRLWDAATGQEKHALKGHTGGVESVAFSPDGRTLASAGGRDETVRLWDVAAG